MSKALSFLCVGLCCLGGCTKKKKAEAAKVLQVEGVASRLCPQGLYTPFILGKLAALPPANQFPYAFSEYGGFDEEDGDGEPVEPRRLIFVSPSPEQGNLELRLCLDPNTFKVTKVLSLVMVHTETEWSRMSDTIEFDWNDKWIVQGLDEALFQDYSKLEILAQVGDGGFYSSEGGPLHVKGWQVDGKSYVTAGRVLFEGEWGNPMALSDVRHYGLQGVLVGDLVQDELPRNGQCKSFEEFNSTTFTAGTAKFRIQHCSFSSLDSTNYRLLKVMIKDKNPALGGPLDVSLDAEELVGKVRIAEGHHSYGLGFRLDLPQASYVVMDLIGGDGGYDVQLPDGPTYEELSEMFFSGQPTRGVYRVKYGGGAWSAVGRTSSRRISSGGEGKFVAKATGTSIFKWNPQTDALSERCDLPENATVGFSDRGSFYAGESPNYVEYQTFDVDIPAAECPGHTGPVAVKSGLVSILDRDWQ